MLAGLLLLSTSLAAAAPAHPRRIASLNLCTDSLLLELAPEDAALSLTRLAQDPRLSPLAALAAHHAVNDGQVEQIVSFNPELVLAAGDDSPAVQLLRRLGYRVETFPPADSLTAYRTMLLNLGALLGVEAQARQTLARLDQRLTTLPRLAQPESAVLLSGNGYREGGLTLGNELLHAVGLMDAGARYPVSAKGNVPLEALVRSPPAWMVAGVALAGAPSMAGEYLGHPALQSAFVDPGRIIPLPEMLWTCGGEYFAQAAETLAQALIRGGGRMQP